MLGSTTKSRSQSPVAARIRAIPPVVVNVHASGLIGAVTATTQYGLERLSQNNDMVNEGKCESQVITADLVGGWKCGLDIGHVSDHEVRMEAHEMNPHTLDVVEVVVKWSTD